VQPRWQGIIGSELPGLARQGGEDILGDLLCRARVLDLAQSRGEDEVEMPLHDVREGRLLAVAREALQQIKILAPLVHLLFRLPLPSANRKIIFGKTAADRSGRDIALDQPLGNTKTQRITTDS